jgi:hypothetical protein
MKKFENLSKPELKAKLEEMKDLLEEVIEERTLILGQENLHLSSRVVERYASELAEIEADIAALEQLTAI